MTIKIVQTVIITMTEDRKVESTSTTENFVVEADTNKLLKNIKTGQTTKGVCVTKKSKIADYIEIDDPSVLRPEPLGSLLGR